MQLALHKYTTLIFFAGLFVACTKSNSSPAVVVTPVLHKPADTTPLVQQALTIDINPFIGGYYAALPATYSSTDKKYPLLISLHGGGQTGNGSTDLPLILNDGVAKLINQHRFPGTFGVNGNEYSFIVLSPQFRDYPPDSMVYSFIDYALTHYRVDSSRIYITGLSMGGILTTEMAGLHTSLFAAAIPVSGESFDADKGLFAANIAKGNLPLWDFHNSDDPSLNVSIAYDFVNLINANNPAVKPRQTIFNAKGHDAWTEALDTSYRENNMNVYEWMLTYKR